MDTGPVKHRLPRPPRIPRLAGVLAVAAALLLVGSQAVSASPFHWFRHHHHANRHIASASHRTHIGAPVPTVHPSAGAPTSTTSPAPKPSASQSAVTPTQAPTKAPPTQAPPVQTGPIITGGWPNASNTGVPAGVSLKSTQGSTITKAGTVIDGQNVNGTITVAADNVTIKNSKVTAHGYWVVKINNGITGTIIENDELNGSGFDGLGNSMGVLGPATVLKCNIYGVENGVTPSSNSKIEGNYIHDLAAPGDPHYDGLQMDGGLSNILVQGNTINNNRGQTSAVMIDDYFGPINNITVNSNYLIGGGYTVYSDGSFGNGSISGVVYSNNVFAKGYYGYALLRNGSVTWTNNKVESSGAAISAHSSS